MQVKSTRVEICVHFKCKNTYLPVNLFTLEFLFCLSILFIKKSLWMGLTVTAVDAVVTEPKNRKFVSKF